MKDSYTEGELAAAERLRMDVAELRVILDTYLEECGRIVKERRKALKDKVLAKVDGDN